MPDITAIGSILSSLKTATDIAKFLRESDISIERAELKLKLAELTMALADVKLEISSIQETVTERDRRIQELEEAFQRKDAIVRKRDAYHSLSPSNEAIGEPMCLRCWDVDHKLYQLHFDAKDHSVKVCPACKATYEGRMAIKIGSDGNASA
jgi:hypothetical protein